jgi:hypothetical protein
MMVSGFNRLAVLIRSADACVSSRTASLYNGHAFDKRLTDGAAVSDGKMNKATARQATLISVGAKLAVQAGRDPPTTLPRPGP